MLFCKMHVKEEVKHTSVTKSAIVTSQMGRMEDDKRLFWNIESVVNETTYYETYYDVTIY